MKETIHQPSLHATGSGVPPFCTMNYIVDSCYKRIYLKYYAGGKKATVFIDRGGNVRFCTIGRYSDGSFLCLTEGDHSGDEDVRDLYCFTVNLFELMSVVK